MDPNVELNIKDFNNPERAKTWAVDKKSIYDPTLPEKNEAGEVVNPGRIADSGAAQEVAVTERDFGRDAALATEKRLEREAKTELTAEEEINMKILEGLTKDKEGNPRNVNAFIEKIVKEGELEGDKYMILNPVTEHLPNIDENHAPETFNGMIVFFCKDGAFSFLSSFTRMRYQDIPEYTNWGDFGKKVHDKVDFYKDQSQYRTELMYDFGDGIKQVDTVDVNKLDLSKTEVRENLAQYIKYAEHVGLKKQIKEEEKRARLDPDEVLRGLGLG